MAYAKLISVTPEAEKTILFIARVSSDQEKTDPGLLRYLIRNQHWSPFEMANMVVEIKNTTRAIATQILRHRSFSFQEFSQRYAVVDEVVMHVGRRQAVKNRQSSIDDLDDETQQRWIKLQQRSLRNSMDDYREAIEMGIAKEQARFLLPLAAATKLYMNGTLRSWIHYLELRTDEHTQLEHRDIANEIKTIFKEQFPVISEALGWIIPEDKSRQVLD